MTDPTDFDSFATDFNRLYKLQIIKKFFTFYIFRKVVKGGKNESSTESSDVEKNVLFQVVSPKRGQRKKIKQSKLEIHHDKKLVLKLPTQDDSSSSTAPEPKRTSSPILIDLDSSSSGTGRKTRSSKRKAEESASNEPKRQKKEKEKVKEKISKNKKQDDKPVPAVQPKKSKKKTSNGSVEPAKKKGLGDYTVDELLKLDGLHKWRYVVDMASNEDCEALEILITERRQAVAAELEKQIKKEKNDPNSKDPLVIKEETQTDGSRDHTSSSEGTEKQMTDATDPTDVTDSDTSVQVKQKKVRRKLNKEFVMFVGDEKRHIKILQLDSDENTPTDSGAESSYHDVLKEVISECTDSDTKDSGVSSNKESSKGEQTATESESDASVFEVSKKLNEERSVTESDASVFEVAVEPKVIPVYELDKSEEKSDSSVLKMDSSSENSDSTTKMYKKLIDGDASKISLQTVSTVSTAPYEDLSDDVPESEESNLKKQIDTCISQVENDVSVGVEDNPQLCVTEKSVEETDKQEKVPDVSVGVEDNPQICVAKKSVEETDKQEKVPDVSVGVVQNPQDGVTEKSVEETDKSETKQGSARVEDNPQICVMEKSVGDQVTEKKEKDGSPSDTTDDSVMGTSSYCESPKPTEVTDSTDLSKKATDDRHKEFAEAFGPQEEM